MARNKDVSHKFIIRFPPFNDIDDVGSINFNYTIKIETIPPIDVDASPGRSTIKGMEIHYFDGDDKYFGFRTERWKRDGEEILKFPLSLTHGKGKLRRSVYEHLIEKLPPYAANFVSEIPSHMIE